MNHGRSQRTHRHSTAGPHIVAIRGGAGRVKTDGAQVDTENVARRAVGKLRPGARFSERQDVFHLKTPHADHRRRHRRGGPAASASHRHHSPIGRLVFGVRATAESANPRQNGLMILEHAVLDVIPGEERHFEESFDQARSIIGSMPGFRSRRLARCIETPSRYLLLVEWDRLEDHTEGFRGSAKYEEYRRRLHHFYDPFPVFEHYEPLVHL